MSWSSEPVSRRDLMGPGSNPRTVTIFRKDTVPTIFFIYYNIGFPQSYLPLFFAINWAASFTASLICRHPTFPDLLIQFTSFSSCSVLNHVLGRFEYLKRKKNKAILLMHGNSPPPELIFRDNHDEQLF